MDANNEYGYFAKQVASDLDITTSTLRRWSIELEKYGYVFERNIKDQRIYHERDYKTIREMKSLIGNGATMIDACKAVVAMFSNNVNAQQTPSVQTDETRLFMRDMMLDELQEMMNDAVEQALEKQRQEYEKYISERLNRIDQRLAERDVKLMRNIRALQQEKQQVQLEMAVSQQKSWWQRLFNK